MQSFGRFYVRDESQHNGTGFTVRDSRNEITRQWFNTFGPARGWAQRMAVTFK